ncbi:MAG: hypothetical protein KAS32_20090 [Candidatus Peribacteraceae bacterium]|nr:hypothetical protein [Candidatus Peribacteraceae bacterium]
MKRINLIVVGLFLVVLNVSCLDKYSTARMAVTVGQAALGVVETTAIPTIAKVARQNCTVKVCLAVDSTKGAKYKECVSKIDQNSVEFKACMKPTEDKLIILKGMIPRGKVLLEFAGTVINAAENAEQGETIDYISPVKKSICFVVGMLDYLPEDMKKKVEVYLGLVKAFTCGKGPGVKLSKTEYIIALKHTRAMLRYIIKVSG